MKLAKSGLKRNRHSFLFVDYIGKGQTINNDREMTQIVR